MFNAGYDCDYDDGDDCDYDDGDDCDYDTVMMMLRKLMMTLDDFRWL